MGFFLGFIGMVALMWTDGERRSYMYLLVTYLLITGYNAQEAHLHLHKVHNEVVGYEYYNEDGTINEQRH